MLLQTICNCFDVGKRNVSCIAAGFEANVVSSLEVGGSGSNEPVYWGLTKHWQELLDFNTNYS